MSEFNIIFFVFPFSDGSGDFSFVHKTIDSLVKRGIPPHRIHLVVSTLLIGDKTSGYKSFEEMLHALSTCKKPDQLHAFDDTLYQTQRNIYDVEQFSITHSSIVPDSNYIRKSNSDHTQFMIKEKLYTDLEDTVKSLCKKYNTILQCDDSDPRISPDINLDQTQHHLMDLIKEQTDRFNRSKIKKILVDQRAEQGISDPPTTEDITEYIKTHFDYTCTIDTNVLLMFLKWTVINDFGVWLTNIIKFFMPLQEKGISFKLIHNNELDQVKRSDFTIDTTDVVLMSFLFDKSTNKTFHESLSIYNHIKLHEGGACTFNTYYSTGFNPTSPMCKGINVLDQTLIDSTYKVPHDGNYHVCYFGNVSISPKMEPTCILTLFKLKYMIHFVKKARTNAIIYVNKSCYQRIRDYTSRDDIDAIYGTMERQDPFIILNGVTVSYYDALSSKEFINFVYYSHPLCILRGDQSYFEGISMGKIILYDMLSFKMPLYEQMLHLYCTFLENNHIYTDTDITKQDISDSIKTIDINDSYLKYQNAVIYNRISNIKYSISTEGFDYNAYVIGPLVKHIYFSYQHLHDLYDLTYSLCKFLLNDRLKTKFISWLYKEYDFEHNLFDLITRTMSTHDSKKGRKKHSCKRYKKGRKSKKAV